MSAQPPSAPFMGGTSCMGPLQVSFSWRAPVDTGSAPITSYELKVTPEGGESVMYTVEGDMISYTVTGLTEGVSIQGSLRASNDNGVTYGPELTFPSVKPIVAPSVTASNPIAKVISAGKVSVSWTGSTAEDNSSGYYLVTSKSSKESDPVIGYSSRNMSETTCELSGLNTTSTYTFDVVIVNNAGHGPAVTTGMVKF